jgi:hypothetical protein
MKRLPGIIFSIVILIIGALFQLLGAAVMGFGGFMEEHHLPTTANPSTMPTQPAWLPFLSYGIAIVCLALAAWVVATAVGLFRMRRWARVSTLVLGGLLVFFGLPGLLMMIVLAAASPLPVGVAPSQAQTLQMVSRIIFAVIALLYACVSAVGIWWLIYFNRRVVRDAFAGISGELAPPLRPILISILAVLNLIGFASCVLMAFAPIPMAIFGLIVNGWAKVATLLVFAALAGICAVGLWRLQEWGRKTAMGLQCLGLANYLFFIFRPTLMQDYQQEVNRSLYLQPSAQLPAQFQSMVQYSAFGAGMLVLISVMAILHHYRAAFRRPAESAATGPELAG